MFNSKLSLSTIVNKRQHTSHSLWDQSQDRSDKKKEDVDTSGKSSETQ